MNSGDEVLVFNATHALIQADLQKVGEELGVDLGLQTSDSEDSADDYYPQVSASIRAEAAEMAATTSFSTV